MGKVARFSTESWFGGDQRDLRAGDSVARLELSQAKTIRFTLSFERVDRSLTGRRGRDLELADSLSPDFRRVVWQV